MLKESTLTDNFKNYPRKIVPFENFKNYDHVKNSLAYNKLQNSNRKYPIVPLTPNSLPIKSKLQPKKSIISCLTSFKLPGKA